MSQGTDCPRAPLRAGSIDYASTLAVLRESLRQLGDLIRLQTAEHDRLTSDSLDLKTALYAWRYSSKVISDALANVEGAHAAFEALTPDVLKAVRHAEAHTAFAASVGP